MAFWLKFCQRQYLIQKGFQLPLKTTSYASSNHRYSNHKLYSTMPKTAGIIIIGDEILKGQTQDTNSYYMCKVLRSIGVVVSEICVIGDNLDVISSKVNSYSKTYDVVLTSGGIGPTHDDITIAGIAQAFDDKLVLNQTLFELCKNYFGDKPVTSPEMKLAHVPTSSKLHFGIDPKTGNSMKFPLLAVGNVYIFPGIPLLLERQLDSTKHIFKSDDVFYSETLLVNIHENQIAQTLTTCAEKYKPFGLTLGSYPDLLNNYYKVKLIVESTNLSVTNEAKIYLQNNLPSNTVLQDYKPSSLGDAVLPIFSTNYFKSSSQTLQENFLSSVKTIEEALSRYQADEICIGFNGGKDCTALLHLYYAVVYKKDPERCKSLLALFIKTGEPFNELDQFMKDTIKRYGLETNQFEGDMKCELAKLLKERPKIKAVLMGTRKTDPYSKNLEAFSPTDDGWPALMRINPILNWSYQDIWCFLRSLNLPYCVLYDQGYTSIGGKRKTSPNEKLKVISTNGKATYLPAYMLQDQEDERFGRL